MGYSVLGFSLGNDNRWPDFLTPRWKVIVEGPCRHEDNENSNLHEGIWEFAKTRGTLFWGPYNKDPTI